MARQFDDISLTKLQRALIHLFGFYDYMEARGLRDRYTRSPSAFTAYFKAADAYTIEDKLRVMRWAKEQKTRHLIQAKSRHGRIPWRMVKKSWTACGWTRLLVAYFH